MGLGPSNPRENEKQVAYLALKQLKCANICINGGARYGMCQNNQDFQPRPKLKGEGKRLKMYPRQPSCCLKTWPKSGDNAFSFSVSYPMTCEKGPKKLNQGTLHWGKASFLLLTCNQGFITCTWQATIKWHEGRGPRNES